MSRGLALLSFFNAALNLSYVGTVVARGFSLTTHTPINTLASSVGALLYLIFFSSVFSMPKAKIKFFLGLNFLYLLVVSMLLMRSLLLGLPPGTITGLFFLLSLASRVTYQYFQEGFPFSAVLFYMAVFAGSFWGWSVTLLPIIFFGVQILEDAFNIQYHRLNLLFRNNIYSGYLAVVIFSYMGIFAAPVEPLRWGLTLLLAGSSLHILWGIPAKISSK